jgi:hypothetical protein
MALSRRAVDPDGRTPVPLMYAVDALAQRWHVHPREIEDDPDPSWLLRGLTFMDFEAQGAAKREGKPR